MKLLHDVAAVLFFDVSIDGDLFHSSREQLCHQIDDRLYLCDESRENNQFLSGSDHVVLDDITQSVQLGSAHLLRL